LKPLPRGRVWDPGRGERRKEGGYETKGRKKRWGHPEEKGGGHFQ
jgi:hypothetical protein